MKVLGPGVAVVDWKEVSASRMATKEETVLMVWDVVMAEVGMLKVLSGSLVSVGLPP